VEHEGHTLTHASGEQCDPHEVLVSGLPDISLVFVVDPPKKGRLVLHVVYMHSSALVDEKDLWVYKVYERRL
jgi:hypothetical protein